MEQAEKNRDHLQDLEVFEVTNAAWNCPGKVIRRQLSAKNKHHTVVSLLVNNDRKRVRRLTEEDGIEDQ